MSSGILFVTYATLRTAERTVGGVTKISRLVQLTDWLGEDFDGVIAFDEAHAMANASGSKSERGDTKPSQQGKAGLDLQNAVPGARVVYVSATGATEVSNLAYASRLGLWGTGDFPFVTRASFVSAMEAGGIAAMEVISRDLKALGLYMARSVSYAGVEYDMLVHNLSPKQIAIYDSYAEAFQVIHNHLDAALLASGVTSDEGTLNAQAKSAARSAFESNKQRFFQHLICAMKCPSLIPAIEADLEAGHSAVVQIVSTSEALLERRLAEIPASEWHDIQLDVTPREYVLDYLQHSFPVQLFEPFTDEDGNLHSRPAIDEAGNLFAAVFGAPGGGIFKLRKDEKWNVSDGDFLPDGDLLVLERRYEGLFGGLGIRIRRIPGATIRPGALIDGPIIFEASLEDEIDNMEGLSVWRDADGRIRLTLVSDDNGSFFQRNLLLEFLLADKGQ